VFEVVDDAILKLVSMIKVMGELQKYLGLQVLVSIARIILIVH
jgi:hypothetical protein